MNIHLPAILMWTTGVQGFDTLPHLPSGYVKIAIENGPVEIVDLPIDSMVIFHSYVT